MARKKTPGLVKSTALWHIDKRINGRRVCQSTRSIQLEKAAAKSVLENQHKRSLHNDIGRLKLLMPWFGDATIDTVHTGNLQPWIDHRRKEGAAVASINQALKVVRRILNLASAEWVDEFGMTWL